MLNGIDHVFSIYSSFFTLCGTEIIRGFPIFYSMHLCKIRFVQPKHGKLLTSASEIRCKPTLHLDYRSPRFGQNAEQPWELLMQRCKDQRQVIDGVGVVVAWWW